MDLEARTWAFFAAHRDLDPEAILAFFAPDARVDYVGLESLDRAGLERLLHTMRGNLAALGFGHVDFLLGTVVTRRNVTFAEWTCVAERSGRAPSEFAGVHVLSWDRDGQVAQATIYTDPEPLRRLAVGSHTPGLATAP